MSRAPEDDVERGLLELVRAELGVHAAHATTLAELGLDELERGRLLHHVEERFARPVPDRLLKGTTRVGELIEHLQRVSYWDYPRPPSGSGADMARADFGYLFVRPALQAAFRLALRAWWRFRVEGRRNIPRRGAFVLVANHNSHMDTPCLLAALPLARVNDVHPLAAHDYFFRSGAVTRIVRLLFNAIPLDREARAESAMKAGLDLLAEEHGLVLFPEGTRSPAGEVQPFRKGVGLLLAGRSIPVLPAFLTGTREVMPKGSRWPRRGTMRLRIGEPVRYADVPDTRDGWKTIAADLEARVRALGRA